MVSRLKWSEWAVVRGAGLERSLEKQSLGFALNTTARLWGDGDLGRVDTSRPVGKLKFPGWRW